MATTSYSQGWLSGVNWTQNSLTTPILAAVSYSGPAGAFGAITSANVGQSAGAALYHYAAQLDSDGRLVADDLVKMSSGAMLYDEQMSYDPVGNVSAVTTILPAGTDHQLFCYDEQNRLTWAGTTTGNPCGNPAATGSFGGASYTQSFGYDTLNRLTSSPLGNYTYGDTNHLHAATSVSSGYTASYDAAGDMQCRAPSSSTTCSGTPTGQQLTWDVEGRLSNWQNATTSPTMTAKYLYDGEGNRVVQQVTDSATGTTTTTSYVGSLETYSITTSSGPTNITTTDYIPAGKVLAESVNGTLSYLATSYQGSVVEALDSTGAVGVIASQLYAPYGGVRYANGSMPTDYGYTGQRADASTGLDYYGARYYDPTVGQFTSADTLLSGGLNRYGYVGGNSTTNTDPTGHMGEGSEEVGGDNGCPDWLKAVCAILTAVSAGISYLHAIGVKDAQNLDDPNATETTLTVGSDTTGTRVKISADEAPIQLIDPNGNPVDPNGKRDSNTRPPKSSPPRSMPGKGQVQQSQTPAINPGIIKGKNGSGWGVQKYQATNEHYQIMMQRLEQQDRIQDTVSTAHPGSDPSWIQVGWAVVEGLSKPVTGVDFQQLGQWGGQLWNGVQDWFDPSPSPGPAICGGVAKAGCIDPENPFGNGDGDPDPEFPVEP